MQENKKKKKKKKGRKEASKQARKDGLKAVGGTNLPHDCSAEDVAFRATILLRNGD